MENKKIMKYDVFDECGRIVEKAVTLKRALQTVKKNKGFSSQTTK